MRGFIPDYTLVSKPTLTETLAFLADAKGTYKPFAGGTELMVLLEAGFLKHTQFISIWHLAEMCGITITDTEIRIGALTTYGDLLRDPRIQEHLPLLDKAAKDVGAVAIQNRGTIGGNLANASPAADSPPSLLVYDASVELSSVRGVRLVPYTDFHVGYKQTQLAADELITAVVIPRAQPAADSKRYEMWHKSGTRKAQAISKVCASFLVDVSVKNGEACITHAAFSFGSVAPIPVLCTKTAASLLQKPLTDENIQEALRVLQTEVQPIDDIRSTGDFRRRIVGNLLAHFLRRVRLDAISTPHSTESRSARHDAARCVLTAP